MKWLNILGGIALAFALGVAGAEAQSTATPVLPGSLTTSGCQPGFTSCYAPYSNANPLPVTATFAPSGTQDVNLKQVNGTTALTGAGATGAGSQRTTVAQDATTIAGAAPGTAASPSSNVVTVQGPTASGAALAGNPILQGASDGTNVQTVKQSSAAANTTGTGVPASGGMCLYSSTLSNLSAGTYGPIPCSINAVPEVAIGGTSAASATGNGSPIPVRNHAGSVGPLSVAPTVLNGSTYDAEFTCPNTAAVSVTAGNTTQIVGLSGTTVIRVCSVSLGISLTGTVNVVTGTGTNCGTPTTISNPIPLVTGQLWAQTAPAGGSLFRSTAGGEICIAAGTGNVTGFISYAQF